MTVLVVSEPERGIPIQTVLEDSGFEVALRSTNDGAIAMLQGCELNYIVLAPHIDFDPWPITNLLRSTDNPIKNVPIVVVIDQTKSPFHRIMMNYYEASALLEFRDLAALPGMLNHLQHEPFKPKILAVDDNPDSLEHIRRFLKTVYDVSCVRSGAEALKAYEDNRYDLVLVDLRMPIMNGFTLIEKLKEKDPTVLIMALSAEMDLAAAIDLHKLGVAGSFSKSRMQSGPLIHAIGQLFYRFYHQSLLALF